MAPTENQNEVIKRLDRLEKELVEMRKAMVQIARTEERVSIVLEQNSELFKKSSSLQDRIAKLETSAATQGLSLSVFERLGWLVITTIAAIVSWKAK